MTRKTDHDRRYRLTRRRVLAASAAATAGLAGCSSEGGTDGDGNEGDDGNENPATQPVETDDRQGTGPTAEFVEDSPDQVYLPTHQDGMQMLPMERAGDYQIMPHWSYSHTFWLVRGTETTREDPGGQSLHFMFMIWDAQTEQLLPVNVAGPMRVYNDESLVGRPGRPWPMISQGMGFHFGDNRQFASDGHSGSLPEEGTYEVELQLRPINDSVVRKTGQFAGRFEETVTATFEFEFTQEKLETVNERTETFDEQRRGSAAAAEPMSGGKMGRNMPAMVLPPAEEYPGELLGQSVDGNPPNSHDAEFVVSYLDDSRLAPDDTGYLLVSPRTPYNRIPLPEITLSVEGVVDGELTETIDDELGHHYGIPADLGESASFDLVVDSPPQVARHRGYQTAFLNMPPMSIER